MKKGEYTAETLAQALKDVAPEITKKDRYDACLEFKEDPFTPLDIRTVNDMMSGKAENIRNMELGADLLSFFQKRAAEYKALEEKRKNEAA